MAQIYSERGLPRKIPMPAPGYLAMEDRHERLNDTTESRAMPQTDPLQ
jgi:hypothetical protein